MVRQGGAVIREPGDRQGEVDIPGPEARQGGVEIPDPDLHRRRRGASGLPRAEAAAHPLQIRFPEAADRTN